MAQSKQQFFSYPFKLSQESGYTVLEVPYTTKTIIDSYGEELTILETRISSYFIYKDILNCGIFLSLAPIIGYLCVQHVTQSLY